MVRLKDISQAIMDSLVSFNSTMVRLKEVETSNEVTVTISFNSTMVRLKACCRRCAAYLLYFQFHYGTIKRLRQKNRCNT